ncbi:MAG: hypothetical protein E7521_03635 [Ruminococcaceae bacterium]|nr:hypothetical protein [Oscillospiraceae bacterium]
MANYNIVLLPEYNKRLKIKSQDFLGFSKKALKKYYNGKNYSIIGEVKKEKPSKDSDRFIIGDEQFTVKQYGSHSAILNRKAGFVCVGEDNYIAVIKSRVPFLLLLLALVAGIVIGGYMLWSMLNGDSVPVIKPDHPLPEIDSNIEEIENDNSGSPNSNISEGGGSVSMIYSLEAQIDLTDSDIDILFKNPSKSNHDVTIELYVTKDNERILIAKSGRIPAGNMLRDMDLMPDTAILTEGIYEGVYKVIYYNPQTGERALVESDITDVAVTVRQ